MLPGAAGANQLLFQQIYAFTSRRKSIKFKLCTRCITMAYEIIIIYAYICVTYFIWSTPPHTFNKSAAGCGNFPTDVNNRVTSDIALYMHLIIRCCNYGVFCASKDALSK